MKKRYPICNHTLAAVRARKQAYRISVHAIVGKRLDNATLRNLVDAAEMAFTEIDEDEMPEAFPSKALCRLSGCHGWDYFRARIPAVRPRTIRE